MLEKVYENVYKKEFPLSGNPLKSINIFVIISDDKNLIIDTGFNNAENRQNMDDLIKELDLDLSKTSLFLTHLHSDHVGLAKYLEDKSIDKIYLSEVDGKIVDSGISVDGLQRKNVIKNAKMQGLIGDIPQALNLDINDHPGFINRPREKFKYIKVNPDDKLEIGDFNFSFIDESGHTPGMLGLYEKDKGILFCGDHILSKITPNITFWADKYGDSLGKYLENIEKIKDLNIKYLFSSHRDLIADVNKRIDELKDHHQKRLNDTISIIEKLGNATTTEITQNMHRDIRAKDRSDFPSSQKRFAVGEASAHLIHLRDKGVIKEIIKDEVAYYSLP